MKIVSFNINGLRARPHQLAALIEKHQPDVIGLQETKVADEQGEAGDVQWNFEKFLLAPDGTVVRRFRPRTAPDAPEVIAAIEEVVPR